MQVNIQYLQEGCILLEDVYSKTKRPIMTEKTVMTKELIDILKAFLVTDVHVERYLVDGEPFKPKETIDDAGNLQREVSFNEMYLEAVRHYKRLFQGWQAGSLIDVAEVRKFFVPLLTKALSQSKDIFLLNHYSTKQEYLYHHPVSVGLISGFLAKKLNLNKGEVIQIALAGCLSDVGMAKVDKAILEKKGSLTTEEFKEIKNHPLNSYKMLQKSPILKEHVLIAVLQHHERLNGSGYPLKKSGDKIHMYSRIISLADVYHAMVSERNFRMRQSPYRVLEMIRQDDFGKFDITVLQALTAGIIQFSIGSEVKLSNGFVGTVVYENTVNPSRPMLRLDFQDELVDLEKRRDLFIESVVKL